MDDNGIINLYLDRDESAIQLTAEKYGARLRALSLGIVKDPRTAEECENDTYMEAWNTIPPHEPRAYLYPFLARIARHRSLDVCRKQARLKRSAYLCELSDELEQCLPSPGSFEDDLDSELLGDAINRFLRTLSGDKRNIFLRRYWYLDSIADIAKRFSISESKVKTTLFRCRASLRKYLEKEGYPL